MVSHDSAKFGSHRHCGSRDEIFLMVEGQHCTYSDFTCKISGRRHINLPVCPMKDFQYWSHTSVRTTAGNHIKNFASPSKNRIEKEKMGKKTRMVIAKLSALQANA